MTSSASSRQRLAELHQVESAGGRQSLGLFSIEGLRLVERALRAGAELEAVIWAESIANATDERVRALRAELARRPDTEQHVVADEAVARLTGGRTYGAVLALVRRPDPPSLAQCLAPRGVLLCAVDAEDPGNVGALVRTALASGAGAFIALGSTDPLHPKAVRTSMGSVFKLPLLVRRDEELLEELRTLGVRSIGAVSRGGTPLPALPAHAGPSALFVGSEAFGLSDELVQQLDAEVTIPMATDVDSLSVNAAAAICLYELLTHRPA